MLTEVERQTLQRWARRAKTSQALALRCKIILACTTGATGATSKAVAEQLGTWPQTVNKWRRRFVADRLDGLADEPRPGRPRTITDDQVEAVIVTTLEEARPTAGRTGRPDRWHGRGAEPDGGQPDLAGIGLKPHQVQTWKLSTDRPLSTKAATSLGCTWLDPPDKALVLCAGGVLVGAVDDAVDADLPDDLADGVGSGVQVGKETIPGAVARGDGQSPGAVA